MSAIEVLKDTTPLLEATKLNIINQYNRLGLKASGSFPRSLIIKDDTLFMGKYGRWIEDTIGRKSGKKQPPQKVIEQWVKEKGIPQYRDQNTGRFLSTKQQVFLIGRKIGEQGTDIFQKKRKGLDYTDAINKAFDDVADDWMQNVIEEL